MERGLWPAARGQDLPFTRSQGDIGNDPFERAADVVQCSARVAEIFKADIRGLAIPSDKKHCLSGRC